MYNFELMSHPVGSVGTVNGVMIATVTNNKDPENIGRVKLKFMIHEQPLETDWAPIASLMSGNDMGTLFIPEVGDEVLVAFHFGHLSKPYVIGCLWNKNKKPPAKDDKNNLRKIRTKSGHELIFDDKDNAGKVTLKTSKGIQIILDDQNDKVSIGTKNDQQKIVMQGAAAGSITIETSGNKLTINNKGDVQLESVKSVTIKSTQVKMEASAMMEIKSGGMLNIESSGMLTLKGAMVKIN